MKTKKSLEKLMMKIGKALAELRMEKGYNSIKEFARDYDLPMIQYWRIERGKANVTLKSLYKLVAIHSLSVQQFFCYMDNN